MTNKNRLPQGVVESAMIAKMLQDGDFYSDMSKLTNHIKKQMGYKKGKKKRK